jgi:hypothetical protein
LTLLELYYFAKKPNIPLAFAKSISPSSSIFNLPLSVEPFDQLQHLESSPMEYSALGGK